MEHVLKVLAKVWSSESELRDLVGRIGPSIYSKLEVRRGSSKQLWLRYGRSKECILLEIVRRFHPCNSRPQISNIQPLGPSRRVTNSHRLETVILSFSPDVWWLPPITYSSLRLATSTLLLPSYRAKNSSGCTLSDRHSDRSALHGKSARTRLEKYPNHKLERFFVFKHRWFTVAHLLWQQE